MTTHEKSALLKAHPIFKDLDEGERLSLAEKMTEKVFAPKEVIIHQEDESNEVYFIYKGLVYVYITNDEGNNIPLGTPWMRSLIGEIESLLDENRTMTFEALLETHTLRLTKEDYKQALKKYPTIALNIMKTMARKLIIANKLHEYTASVSLKDRTWEALQLLAPQFPNNEITLSHEEIGRIVGGTRARITEVLNALEKEHVLSLAKRNIQIL